MKTHPKRMRPQYLGNFNDIMGLIRWVAQRARKFARLEPR